MVAWCNLGWSSLGHGRTGTERIEYRMKRGQPGLDETKTVESE